MQFSRWHKTGKGVSHLLLVLTVWLAFAAPLLSGQGRGGDTGLWSSCSLSAVLPEEEEVKAIETTAAKETHGRAAIRRLAAQLRVVPDNPVAASSCPGFPPVAAPCSGWRGDSSPRAPPYRRAPFRAPPSLS